MNRWIKIIIWIIATPVILIGILLLFYVIMNRQGMVDPFHTGNPQAENRILIASQGSKFKESLVNEIIQSFDDPETFFSVIDCTTMEDVIAEEWDAIIIIHTMQIHHMPAQAKSFLSQVRNYSNIMLVCTSGGGDEVVTEFDVDAISSPSRMNKLPRIIDWIGKRLHENTS